MKRVAIITSSDTGYRGEREDLSGPAIKEIVEREGYEVVSMDILPDDQVMLAGKMQEIADKEMAELILTTGGTGFSEREAEDRSIIFETFRNLSCKRKDQGYAGTFAG